MNRVGKKLLSDQRGVSGLLISTVLLALLFVAAAGGFVWAYSQYTDWKTNGEQKIAAAVDEAKNKQKDDDQAAFNEQQKKPYLTYNGPTDLGTVQFNYPKTWAGFTSQNEGGSLSLYFYPTMVPPIKDGVTPYALRVLVDNQSYDDAVKSYEGLVKDGKATASTLVVGKTESFDGYKGVRVDGQLTETTNGSVSIFKVRDKTLRLFVDSQSFMNDYNNVILKSLVFKQ